MGMSSVGGTSRRTWALVAVAVVVAATSVGWWNARNSTDVACGAQPPGPGALTGFDPDSGAVVWSRTVGATAGHTRAGDSVVVRTQGYRLRSYELTTGELRWCRALSRSGYSDRDWGVVAIGEVVAVFDGGDVIGLDVTSGEELWRSSAPPPGELFMVAGTSIWLDDGGSGENPTIALDPADGSVDPNPGPRPRAYEPQQSTTVDGLTLEVDYRNAPAREGFTATVTDVDDSLVWSTKLPGSRGYLLPSSQGPVIVAVKSTGSYDGHGTGFDARTGSELWQAPISVWSAQAWDLNTDLLYLAWGSEVSALDPATGNQVWVTEHANPGRGGKYSEPGFYEIVAATDVVVALIEAREPYRY